MEKTIVIKPGHEVNDSITNASSIGWTLLEYRETIPTAVAKVIHFLTNVETQMIVDGCYGKPVRKETLCFLYNSLNEMFNECDSEEEVENYFGSLTKVHISTYELEFMDFCADILAHLKNIL